MNILVIGNGFDLAHGPPTKYTDFLKFCEMACKIYESEKLDVRSYEIICLAGSGLNEEIRKQLLTVFASRKDHSDIDDNNKLIHTYTTDYPKSDELYTLIQDNVWIEYFLQCNSFLKENWIDFESEICRIVKLIDNDVHKNGGLNTVVRDISEIFFENYFLDNLDERIQKRDEEAFVKYAGLPVGEQSKYVEQYIQDNPVLPLKEEISYGDLIKMLEGDLNKLIRALEIYLCDYVEKIDIKEKSPDIDGLEIDFILSFNYTHIFSKLYDVSSMSKQEIADPFDYVHGEADISNTVETNNMVLGIDEYLSDDRKNFDVDFIAFKKFYQRIYKQTGSKYKEWMEKIQRSYIGKLDSEANCKRLLENAMMRKDMEDAYHWFRNMLNHSEERKAEIHNIYIFGHSLDITDKDILRDLILNDNVQTTIFYHDKDTMGQQIANLVKVIGQDELIRRTGGNTKTIEFKLQKPMIPIEN